MQWSWVLRLGHRAKTRVWRRTSGEEVEAQESSCSCKTFYLKVFRGSFCCRGRLPAVLTSTCCLSCLPSCKTPQMRHIFARFKCESCKDRPGKRVPTAASRLSTLYGGARMSRPHSLRHFNLLPFLQLATSLSKPRQACKCCSL